MNVRKLADSTWAIDPPTTQREAVLSTPVDPGRKVYMYLFSRRAHLVPGNTRQALQWAQKITEKANQISDLQVTAHQTIFSPEVGTIAWVAQAPDLERLELANDKLLQDNSYVTLLDQGEQFLLSGIDDMVRNIIDGAFDPASTDEYTTLVTAVCANGSVAVGIETGVQIAQRAHKVTGRPTAFATNLSGPYGAVAWLTRYPNIQELERAQTMLQQDTGFTKFVDDSAPGVYIEEPNITRQMIFRRLQT